MLADQQSESLTDQYGLYLADQARFDLTMPTPTGHWPLQDYADSTTIVGLFGGNGTLTNAGNTSASTTTGPGTAYPRAISFAGDDYITLAAPASLGSDFTLAYWFNRSASADRAIMYNITAEGFLMRNGNVTAARFAPAAANVVFSATLSTTDNIGVWAHYAIVCVANSIQLYVNGSAVPSAAAIDPGTRLLNRIGNNSSNSAPAVSALADFRVYDVGLSTQELAEVVASVNQRGSAGGAMGVIGPKQAVAAKLLGLL